MKVRFVRTGWRTVMVMGVDSVIANPLSRDLAVSVCVPTGALLQTKLDDPFAASPSFRPLSKNSTRLMKPSASLALALSTRLVGARNCAPFAGAVMAIDGG